MASRWTHKSKLRLKLRAKIKPLSMIIGSHEADLNAADQRSKAAMQAMERRGFLPDRCAFIILTSTSSTLNKAFQPIFPAETPSGERENARTKEQQ